MELNSLKKNLNDALAELEHYKKLTASRDIDISHLNDEINKLKDK